MEAGLPYASANAAHRICGLSCLNKIIKISHYETAISILGVSLLYLDISFNGSSSPFRAQVSYSGP
jgi:hypothetical protein